MVGIWAVVRLVVPKWRFRGWKVSRIWVGGGPDLGAATAPLRLHSAMYSKSECETAAKNTECGREVNDGLLRSIASYENVGSRR